MHSRLSHLAIGWSTSDPVPTILHVSHESREEALKSYQLSFGSTFHNPKIFFDFSKDTLCFGKGLEDAHLTDRNGVYLGPRTPHNYMLDSFLGSANDSEKIQSMIIDIPEDVYARRSFIWDDIRLFTGLRDLTIMPWEEDRFENELSQHYRETLWIVTQDHAEWIVPKINVVSGLSWKQWHPVRAMRMD